MVSETQIVCQDGTRLRVGVAGSGPALLFIGGTGWDLRTRNTPLQSLLTKRFTVALFDQRGQGRSDKPDGPYSMQGYAEDACAVADELGWERPHVVGYSFGGMVAQEYAIRFPTRISRLVLMATTPGGAGGRSYPIQDLLDLPPEERARRGLQISDLRFEALQRADPAAAQRQIEQRIASQTRFAGEPRAMLGLRAQLAARATHDCYDRLRSIRAPALVVAGQEDGQAPMDAQIRMADRLPDAEIKTLPGAHGYLFDNDLGYRTLSDFLSG